jgi:hypothetical protein
VSAPIAAVRGMACAWSAIAPSPDLKISEAAAFATSYADPTPFPIVGSSKSTTGHSACLESWRVNADMLPSCHYGPCKAALYGRLRHGICCRAYATSWEVGINVATDEQRRIPGFFDGRDEDGEALDSDFGLWLTLWVTLPDFVARALPVAHTARCEGHDERPAIYKEATLEGPASMNGAGTVIRAGSHLVVQSRAQDLCRIDVATVVM